MTPKSNSATASVAKKILSLATVLSLGTLSFVGIGTGAALSAPTSDSATSSANTTKVIKLANGKTRIKVDLADNLRGKTIVVKTTRIANGKRVQVTLGKIKLTKTGKGKLTVSRKIRLDDRLVISDGMRNIVSSRVSLIDDRRTGPVLAPVPSPPSGGGGAGGGGGSGASSATPTFTVIESGTQPNVVVTFGGTATGDITFIQEQDGTFTFARAGINTATTANGASIAKFTVGSGQTLNLTGNQVGIPIDGSGNVTVSALNENPNADLSIISNTGAKNAVVSGDVTFVGDLGTFTTTVSTGKTFTAAVEVAELKAMNGAGSVVLTGAWTGNSYSLNNIEVTGGFSIAFATGGQLNGGSGFGSASFSIPGGQGIEGFANQLDGRTVTGAGYVRVKDLQLYPDADLSLISNSGNRQAEINDNVTFTGDLGTMMTIVASGKILTASAAVVDGKRVIGQGTVSVTDLRSHPAVDLSLITTVGLNADFAGTSPTAFTGILGSAVVSGLGSTDTIAFTSEQSAEADATAVNAGGKWHFNSASKLLTYQIGTSKFTATLTGVASLTHGANKFTIG